MKTLIALLLMTTLVFPMERFIGFGGTGLIEDEQFEAGWSFTVYHQTKRFVFPVQIDMFNAGNDFAVLGGVRASFGSTEVSKQKLHNGLFVGIDIGGLNYPDWGFALLPYVGSRRNLLFGWLFTDVNAGYEIVNQLIVVRLNIGVKL